MNLNTEDSLSFHQYLKSGIPFAYFRLPGDSHIHFIAQSDTKLYTTQNLDDLNGQEGFVVAPFSADSASPVCLIRADIREKYNCQMAPQNASFASAKIVDIANDYSENFDLFRKALISGEFDKLVLSRKQEHNIPTSFNIWDSFIKACQIYPNSYIYLLYTPQTGLCMAISPELLLSRYLCLLSLALVVFHTPLQSNISLRMLLHTHTYTHTHTHTSRSGRVCVCVCVCVCVHIHDVCEGMRLLN